MRIHRLETIEKTDNGYILHTDKADVLLVFMTEDILRIRVHFDRQTPMEESSYTLVLTAWEDRMDELLKEERTRIQALEVPYTESEGKLIFDTGKVKLVLNREPFCFTLLDKEGHVLHQDLPSRAYEKDQLGRIGHYSVLDREKDHFYGFGEKTGHLDKKLRRMRMSPKDAIGQDPEFGDPLYKHIPFYIHINEDGYRAVGLYYHNSYDCTFDMGQEISAYWGSYSCYQADGGDLDLFLMAGPSAAHVLDSYTRLTGRSALPTKQSLGYCASTMYYAELEKDCDKEIYNVIDKQEKEEIPIDNFWLASGYTSGEEDNLRYVFNWNYRRFPKPKEFFDEMNRRGINVIPNLKPGILRNHPYREFFEENDAFIKNPDGCGDYEGSWWGGPGRFIDFTNPRAREAWKTLLKKQVLEMGTKTVWNDNCEMDGVEDRNAQCDYEGRKGTMAELKILHSNLMAYLGKQALKEVYPGERPYIINRAGYAGIQRYAQVWAGDNLTSWKTLKFNIATIIGMGLSGCSNMGCDIGGFAGPAPEPELLLRWVQNGIFQPRFCMNSANNDNTVTQPWMYEELTGYVREAFALRYRLLPYLYSLMRESNQNGMPAWRPLFLEFPEDPACYTDENMTFMFGPGLLVANVVEKEAKTRRLYLPKGCTWYELSNHFKAYEGGQSIEIPVELGSIPVFLRGSAIVPTTKDVRHILSDTMKSLDILVSAEENVSFDLYDDDGHTQEYQKGVYARTHITATAGERTEIVFDTEGSYASPVEYIRVKLVSKKKGAYWAALNGELLPRFIIRDEFDAAKSGWYYEMSDRTILVKFPAKLQGRLALTVSTEQFDLIGMKKD